MEEKVPGLEIAEKEITDDMDEQAQLEADQSNRKTEQNVARAAVMATLLQDYLQFQTQSFKDYIKQCDHSETHQALNESLQVATAYCDSVSRLGAFQKSLKTPQTSSFSPVTYIRPRFYLEYFGSRLAHNTLREASQKISVAKIENLSRNVINNIMSVQDPDAIAFAADPLTKDGQSFGFTLDEDGNIYKTPSEDIQEIRLKLNDCRDAQGNVTMAAVYDSLSQMLSKNPMEQGTEEILNRIYINGENAYDKYHRGDRNDLVSMPDLIRTIMGEITLGEKRAELVRLEGVSENSSKIKPVILPIHVDFTGTPATQEAVNAYKQLWQNDPHKKKRHKKNRRGRHCPAKSI